MFASFSIMSALRVAGVVAGLALLWFVVDQIGDAREAKVYAEINAAIEKTNVAVDKQLSLDERISALAEAARVKALGEAKKLPISAQCQASPEQASALNSIK